VFQLLAKEARYEERKNSLSVYYESKVNYVSRDPLAIVAFL